MRWSRGLRAVILGRVTEPERSGEELAAEECDGDLLAVIQFPVWSRIRAAGLEHAVLVAAEDGGLAALRAYVQVLHDQLAGTGVHATIVTITKGIGSEARFDAAALARAYLGLHNQPETEWQPELVI